jgi:hypothetical protein
MPQIANGIWHALLSVKTQACNGVIVHDVGE